MIINKLEESFAIFDDKIKVTRFDSGKYIKEDGLTKETGLIEIKFPKEHYNNFVYVRDLYKNLYKQKNAVLKADKFMLYYVQNISPANTYIQPGLNQPYLSFEDMLYEVFIKHKYFMITKPTNYVGPQLRVIIKVTRECNLDCPYCYDRVTRNTLGNPEVLDLKYIEHLCEMATKSRRVVHFQFHGGEPLLADYEWYRAILEDIIPKYPWIEAHFTCQSNLLNATDEIVELFAKHNVSMGSSWNILNPKLRERLPDNPNRAVYKDSKSRVQEINAKYQDLLGYKVGVIDVLTNEEAEFLIKSYEAYKQEGMHAVFNFIYIVQTMKDDVKSMTFTGKDFTKLRKHVGDFAEHILNDEKDPYDERFINNFIEIVCGLGSGVCTNTRFSEENYLGIQSDGTLIPCDTPAYNTRYSIGHILDYNSIDEIKNSTGQLNLIEDLHYQEDVFCKNCDYKTFCNGGCPMRNIEVTGSAKQSSPIECALFKTMFNCIYESIREKSFDDIKNPIVQEKLKRYHVVMPQEIQTIYKEITGQTFEHNPHDLFNSEEYKIFRMFNPVQDIPNDTGFQRGHINLYNAESSEERLAAIKAYLGKNYNTVLEKLKAEGEEKAV